MLSLLLDIFVFFFEFRKVLIFCTLLLKLTALLYSFNISNCFSVVKLSLVDNAKLSHICTLNHQNIESEIMKFCCN